MATRNREPLLKAVKMMCILIAMLPATRLAWLASHDALGANPIEYVSRATGWWTLAGIMVTLGVTPLRRILGWHWLIRFRRTFGLCTFTYGILHLLTYLWLDQFFDWSGMLKDVFKRPFITVGFAALVMMLPLAITSSNATIRRLGGKRWQRLHRLVYAVAILGVVHFWWLVKKDIREPAAFALILAFLLATRIWFFAQGRAARRGAARSQVA